MARKIYGFCLVLATGAGRMIDSPVSQTFGTKQIRVISDSLEKSTNSQCSSSFQDEQRKLEREKNVLGTFCGRDIGFFLQFYFEPVPSCFNLVFLCLCICCTRQLFLYCPTFSLSNLRWTKQQKRGGSNNKWCFVSVVYIPIIFSLHLNVTWKATCSLKLFLFPSHSLLTNSHAVNCSFVENFAMASLLCHCNNYTPSC